MVAVLKPDVSSLRLTRAAAGANVPAVPARVFRELAGPELAGALDRHDGEKTVEAWVLFADEAGRRFGLLPVGPGQVCAQLEQAAGVEIEGMFSLCAWLPGRPSEATVWAERLETLRAREEVAADRERYVAACHERLKQISRTLAEREGLLVPPLPDISLPAESQAVGKPAV